MTVDQWRLKHKNRLSEPDERAEMAKSIQQEGWKVIKVRLHHDEADKDIETIEKIVEKKETIENLIEEENIQFDVIFGPAYKGIPLAAAVATIISGRTSNLVSISFDRKEEKTHGEGGKIVGSVKGKKVLILDDVLTAGTALNQSINLVREMGGEVVSSVVALDREELVEGVLARDLIVEKTNSKLLSIATISQLVDFFNQTNKTKEARLISRTCNFKRNGRIRLDFTIFIYKSCNFISPKIVGKGNNTHCIEGPTWQRELWLDSLWLS